MILVLFLMILLFIVEVQEVEDFAPPVFEKVANPDHNPCSKINNSPNVEKITTTAGRNVLLKVGY